jgi:hypothetical protein
VVNLLFGEENFLQILTHWIHVVGNLSQLTTVGKEKHDSGSRLPDMPNSLTVHQARRPAGVICEKVNLCA